jgi:hypothetical protein
VKLGGHSLNSYIGGLKTFVQLPEKFWRRFGAPLNEKSAQLVVLQLVTLILAEREGLFSPSISLEISYFCLAQYVRVRYVCHDLGFYRAKSARGGFVALFLILLLFYSLFIRSCTERNIIAVCAGVRIFAAMNNSTQLPDCLLGLEDHVRQYIELEVLQEQLRPILVVPSTHETVTHMGVRLATEREIQGRKDYLAEYITKSVVEMFRRDGRLSKCAKSRNELVP